MAARNPQSIYGFQTNNSGSNSSSFRFSETNQAKEWIFSQQSFQTKKLHQAQAHGLRLEEYDAWVRYYSVKIWQDITSLAKKLPKLPPSTLIIFRRFCLTGKLLEVPTNQLLLTCGFLAGKVEEARLELKVLLKQFKVDFEEFDIMKAELSVLQTLHFHINFYHPFSPFVGFVSAYEQETQQKVEPEKVNSGHSSFVELMIFSDAIFFFPPSIIALAVLNKLHTKCFEFCWQKLLDQNLESRHLLESTMQETTKYINSFSKPPIPSAEQISALEKKMQSSVKNNDNMEM